MKNTQLFYLERVDHLRFFAALLVLLFHILSPAMAKMDYGYSPLLLITQGYSGVGLFMVLSGFIFTVIAHDKEIDYGKFIRNRLLRIYPLFIFMGFLAWSLHIYSDPKPPSNLEFLLLLLPIRLPFESAYFQSLWTIPVEFQFYLIFPFLALFMRREGAAYLLRFIALLIILRLGVYVTVGTVRVIAYETILGRLDQFLIGMLLARCYGRLPRLAGNPLHLLASFALVLASLLYMGRNGGQDNPPALHWVIWTTWEGAMWGWFALAYINCRLVIPKRLSQGLAALGSISFSIYVNHIFVTNVVGRFTARLVLSADPLWNAYLLGGLITVPVVLAISYLTYRVIELPFLNLRSPYLRKITTAVADRATA